MQYVDAVSTAVTGKVAKAGDTMSGALIIAGSSATDMLRVTQTGAGNALVVEDSANPDATPFVVTATGLVGIGVAAPGHALDVNGYIRQTAIAASTLHIMDTADARVRGIYAQTGGELRWIWNFADNITEDTVVGSNVGSNMSIVAWGEDSIGASVALGTVLHSSRATRNVGIGGAAYASSRLVVRTPTAAADESGIAIVNATSVSDSSVDLLLQTGGGATRARIRGQREGSANNGKFVVSTFVSATETDALTIGSDRVPVFNIDRLRLTTAKTPASATATGVTGDVCWDASYLYVCIATNSWRRAAHAAW